MYVYCTVLRHLAHLLGSPLLHGRRYFVRHFSVGLYICSPQRPAYVADFLTRTTMVAKPTIVTAILHMQRLTHRLAKPLAVPISDGSAVAALQLLTVIRALLHLVGAAAIVSSRGVLRLLPIPPAAALSYSFGDRWQRRRLSWAGMVPPIASCPPASPPFAGTYGPFPAHNEYKVYAVAGRFHGREGGP